MPFQEEVLKMMAGSEGGLGMAIASYEWMAAIVLIFECTW